MEARVCWERWHRSGQKAPLTTFSDKPTSVQSWHTSHVLWHYVSSSFPPRSLRDSLLTKFFLHLTSPAEWKCVLLSLDGPQPATTCAVYGLYNNSLCWCAGVGVKVCVIGTRCRYEAPCRVIALPSCLTAGSLSDPWTHVTLHSKLLIDMLTLLLRWCVHFLMMLATKNTDTSFIKKLCFLFSLILRIATTN